MYIWESYLTPLTYFGLHVTMHQLLATGFWASLERLKLGVEIIISPNWMLRPATFLNFSCKNERNVGSGPITRSWDENRVRKGFTQSVQTKTPATCINVQRLLRLFEGIYLILMILVPQHFHETSKHVVNTTNQLIHQVVAIFGEASALRRNLALNTRHCKLILLLTTLYLLQFCSGSVPFIPVVVGHLLCANKLQFKTLSLGFMCN